MKDLRQTLERLLSDSIDLRMNGDFRGALDLAREAADKAGSVCPNSELQAAALIQCARNSYYLSLFVLAHDYLNSLETFLSKNTPKDISISLEVTIIRSNICRRTGEYGKSLEMLCEFPDENETAIPARLIVEKYLIEGACRYYLNDTSEALESLEAALGKATGPEAPAMRSRILSMMGLVMRRRGFIRKAADDFNRAAGICRERGDKYGLAAALLNLGIVRYHQGQFREAERSVAGALSLFNEIDWEIGACRCMIALGNISLRMDADEIALEYYSDAGAIARRNGFRREVAMYLTSLGWLHLEKKDLERAGNCFSESRSIISEIAPSGDIASEVSRGFAELEQLRGNVSKSIEHAISARDISDELGEMMELGLAYRAIGLSEFSRKNIEAAKENFVKAKELIRDSGCTFELARTCLLFAESLFDIGSSSRETIHSALEAVHLFDGTDADSWKQRTENILKRTGAAIPEIVQQGEGASQGNGFVEMAFHSDYRIYEGFVAVSSSMHEVWNRIRFAASFPGPVLITGETGTGKELVAKLIHESSNRSLRPFIPVNCAAIPAHLFESEFFGHKKGCFTGAATERKGLFEEADGGTLFLDEIGELSALQQAKLLRVLQEGKVRKIGENQERSVDIKIISATNQDLRNKIEESDFREDFFYRINAEQIYIPPLREHIEDILPLALWRLGGNGNDEKSTFKIEKDVIKILQKYHWPGNVRELIAIVDRIKQLCDGRPIVVDMLPGKLRGHISQDDNHKDAFQVERLKNRRDNLEKAMTVCKGNKSAAARWLGISRGTLYKELKRTGLYMYYSRHQVSE
jgi:DNA-binding NtrC family response regulator/tetratricopeptide (TPR) repeat protein